MANEFIQGLFQKYLAGSVSPEELEQLGGWIRDDRNQTALEELVGTVFTNKELTITGDYEPYEMYLEFLERIKTPIESQAPVIPIRRRLVPAIAAAIILLIGIGAATWIYLSRPAASPTGNNINQSVTKIDIAPGTNKAILTLAGGQQVILDAAANGRITGQGNTDIIKTDGGKLAYRPTTQTAATVYNTLTTPRGGQYQLTLVDGTKVWLDAASSITYPTAFTGPERKVSVTGQAYFEVKHDPRQPFKVATPYAEIKDIGTGFNVNAYPDEPDATVTLVEGAVAVNKLSLSPGQQAQISPNGAATLNPAPDLEEVLAWKNGLFQFKSSTIQTVLRQISRWYDVEVVYPNGFPGGHISGKFPRNMNLSKVEKALELSGVQFTIQEHKIIIMP